MLLPVALLWAAGSAQLRRQPSQQAPWLSGRKPWLSASALLLLLAALLSSASRGGIATGVFVLLLAWALLLGRSGQNAKVWRYWLHRLFPLALLGMAVATGGLEWLQRYEAGDPLRLLNWAATWHAVQMFWPLGSGLGTFEWMYPLVQPPELGVYFVNFAHNDYLQLLMEGGALVLPVAFVLVGLLVHRAAQLTKARFKAHWSDADALAVACGLGFLSQALHAWVDYPWRIPATAMLGSFLLGVFLRRPNSDFGRSRDLASQT